MPSHVTLSCLAEPAVQYSSSFCQTKSCAPRESININPNIDTGVTYENQAAHHIHARAKAGKEEDLVAGDKEFASVLFPKQVSTKILSISFYSIAYFVSYAYPLTIPKFVYPQESSMGSFPALVWIVKRTFSHSLKPSAF